jgi:hypothetical protein
VTVGRRSAMALLALLALLLAACSGGSTHPPKRAATGSPASSSDAPSGGGSSGGTAPAASSPASPTALVKVVSWGVADGLLSVIVENTSGSVISSARAIITARDAEGSIVSSSSGPIDVRCCTLFGVPPGGRYGVYASVGPAASRVSSVQVTLVAPELAKGAAPKITATGAKLVARQPVVEVEATLDGTPGSGPYVAVQALLADPSGFIAVMSGRYYCIHPGTPLHVRLHLWHVVPAGTRVQEVLAYSVPAGVSGTELGLPACGAGAPSATG